MSCGGKISPLGVTGLNFASGAHLSVENASWFLPEANQMILHPINFDLPAGKVLGVVGPNGAGKSSLLRLLYRYYAPTTGTVKIDGADINQMSARAAACKVAAVLQEQPTDFGLTVHEIVALGRTPYIRGFGGVTDERGARVVQGALRQLDLLKFAERQLGTLSGGERQRVMVARALCQEPSLLILDEPTNHLDIHHQLEVLELIREMPLTIVTSLHDLNLAASNCDDVLLLKEGKPLGFGSADEVFSEAAISQAFRVRAKNENLSPSNTKHLTFTL